MIPVLLFAAAFFVYRRKRPTYYRGIGGVIACGLVGKIVNGGNLVGDKIDFLGRECGIVWSV